MATILSTRFAQPRQGAQFRGARQLPGSSGPGVPDDQQCSRLGYSQPGHPRPGYPQLGRVAASSLGVCRGMSGLGIYRGVCDAKVNGGRRTTFLVIVPVALSAQSGVHMVGYACRLKHSVNLRMLSSSTGGIQFSNRPTARLRADCVSTYETPCAAPARARRDCRDPLYRKRRTVAIRRHLVGVRPGAVRGKSAGASMAASDRPGTRATFPQRRSQ